MSFKLIFTELVLNLVYTVKKKFKTTNAKDFIVYNVRCTWIFINNKDII